MGPIVAAALLLSLVACEGSGTTSNASSSQAPGLAAKAPADPGAASASTGLVLVKDSSLVCMVNDQFMGRTQIPIEVAGRTYYGCCEDCKAKLANDPTARTATDPATGEAVDKSKAVIAQEASGKVLYFASEANFASYAATPRPL